MLPYGLTSASPAGDGLDPIENTGRQTPVRGYFFLNKW